MFNVISIYNYFEWSKNMQSVIVATYFLTGPYFGDIYLDCSFF